MTPLNDEPAHDPIMDPSEEEQLLFMEEWSLALDYVLGVAIAL